MANKNLTLGLLLCESDLHLLDSWINNHKELTDNVIIGYTSYDQNLTDLVKKFPGYDVFYCSLRDDFAQARNRILERSGTEFLLFLDADELLTPKTKEFLVSGVCSIDFFSCNRKEIISYSFNRLNLFNRSFVNPENRHACLIKKGVRYVNNSPYKNASPGCHETPDCKILNLELTIVHLKENWTGNFRDKGYEDYNQEQAKENLKKEIEKTK